jgi:hypothetical protein
MNTTGPFVGVEAAYRADSIRANYGTAKRNHHPIRRIGRAISNVHHRLEGV